MNPKVTSSIPAWCSMFCPPPPLILQAIYTSCKTPVHSPYAAIYTSCKTPVPSPYAAIYTTCKTPVPSPYAAIYTSCKTPREKNIEQKTSVMPWTKPE